MSDNFTKLRELDREIGYRRHVFPKLIAQGRMKQDDADRRIAIMEEIADDYRAKVREEQPELFP